MFRRPRPRPRMLHPGDLIEVLLPGGGGYGPPAERDPALRQRDLQQGYVLATSGSASRH